MAANERPVVELLPLGAARDEIGIAEIARETRPPSDSRGRHLQRLRGIPHPNRFLNLAHTGTSNA
jgi:hypothetical protein